MGLAAALKHSEAAHGDIGSGVDAEGLGHDHRPVFLSFPSSSVGVTFVVDTRCVAMEKERRVW